MVDEDVGLSPFGSKAECHELVSSEHIDEKCRVPMAESEVETQSHIAGEESSTWLQSTYRRRSINAAGCIEMTLES